MEQYRPKRRNEAPHGKAKHEQQPANVVTHHSTLTFNEKSKTATTLIEQQEVLLLTSALS